MQYLSRDLQAVEARQKRRRRRTILLAVLVVVALIFVYSSIFHVLMQHEGREYNWAGAIYWTITTMSTLGFGDITFTSTAGRLFSIIVLATGVVVILMLLPYLFIQFVVTPWLKQRERSRIARRVPETLRGHIVLVGLDTVTQTLIARAKRAEIPTMVLVDDPLEAIKLQDEGYQVMVGPIDSLATYRRAGVERALMVVSTQADTTNTNVTFTVRAVSDKVRIAVTADKTASTDVLQLAGADYVIQLSHSLGTELAARVLGTGGESHVLDTIGHTLVAEAAVQGTSLLGLTLADAQAHIQSGTRILAVLQRGRLLRLKSSDALREGMVLVIAGSQADLQQYDQQFQNPQTLEGPVLILGGGRVGRAVAAAFETSGEAYSIVEQVADRVPEHLHAITGDAADIEVLESAGLSEASAVVITTHDDDLNVYLTLYCRRLRPDLQIIARSSSEYNVATLYRAGADSVLSYAAIGATGMWNTLGHTHRVVLAEGSELFTVELPRRLQGAELDEHKIYEATGCHVVGALNTSGEVTGVETLATDHANQLILLGDRHAERAFRNKYLKKR